MRAAFYERRLAPVRREDRRELPARARGNKPRLEVLVSSTTSSPLPMGSPFVLSASLSAISALFDAEVARRGTTTPPHSLPIVSSLSRPTKIEDLGRQNRGRSPRERGKSSVHLPSRADASPSPPDPPAPRNTGREGREGEGGGKGRGRGGGRASAVRAEAGGPECEKARA